MTQHNQASRPVETSPSIAPPELQFKHIYGEVSDADLEALPLIDRAAGRLARLVVDQLDKRISKGDKKTSEIQLMRSGTANLLDPGAISIYQFNGYNAPESGIVVFGLKLEGHAFDVGGLDIQLGLSYDRVPGFDRVPGQEEGKDDEVVTEVDLTFGDLDFSLLAEEEQKAAIDGFNAALDRLDDLLVNSYD